MWHEWETFFVMLGTSGATLIGLMFVVITLGADLRHPDASRGIDTFLTPTLAHFGSVLFQSLAMVVPWPFRWPIVAILAALGFAGLVYQIHVFRSMRALNFVALHGLDWIPYSVLPMGSSVCLLAGAAGAATGSPFMPFAVAAGGVLLLVAGIFGAWDLTLWIVRNRAPRG